jgi:hypothetical protein
MHKVIPLFVDNSFLAIAKIESKGGNWDWLSGKRLDQMTRPRGNDNGSAALTGRSTDPPGTGRGHSARALPPCSSMPVVGTHGGRHLGHEMETMRYGVDSTASTVETRRTWLERAVKVSGVAPFKAEEGEAHSHTHAGQPLRGYYGEPRLVPEWPSQ